MHPYIWFRSRIFAHVLCSYHANPPRVPRVVCECVRHDQRRAPLTFCALRNDVMLAHTIVPELTVSTYMLHV